MPCLAYTELSTLPRLPSLLFQTTLACQTTRTSILLLTDDSLKGQDPATVKSYI